jgi:glycerate 2-kinase
MRMWVDSRRVGRRELVVGFPKSGAVELVGVTGLQRLPGDGLAPPRAGTFGLGQLVTAALDQRARTIILGLGGGASADGGAGMMQALGLRLLDRADQPIGRSAGPVARSAAAAI